MRPRQNHTVQLTLRLSPRLAGRVDDLVTDLGDLASRTSVIRQCIAAGIPVVRRQLVQAGADHDLGAEPGSTEGVQLGAEG